jgi:hypothetical protein
MGFAATPFERKNEIAVLSSKRHQNEAASDAAQRYGALASALTSG